MEPFSCDLVTNAQRHKTFLATLHLSGTTLHPPSLESLRRYSELWLPLVAAQKSTNFDYEALIPPKDIAWLWHCHRLAPARYEKYSVQRFGKLLEASNPFTCQISHMPHDDETFKRACLFTHERWCKQYPDEPFDEIPIAYIEQNHEDLTRSQKELIHEGFNLLESCSRQSSFLWQVSGDRFNDVEFLHQGADKYYKFLQLKGTSKGRSMIIIPTYQIDLMWHTHILSSISKYNDDCRTIIGCSMNHDDSLTDRVEGGTLDVSFRATKALWYEMYGEEYTVEGGMYRGEPPVSFYRREWSQSQEGNTHVVLNAADYLVVEQMYHHLVGVVGASSTGVFETSKDFSPDVSPSAPPLTLPSIDTSLADPVPASSEIAIIHADVITAAVPVPTAVAVESGASNLEWTSGVQPSAPISMLGDSSPQSTPWISRHVTGAFIEANFFLSNEKKDGYIFGDHASTFHTILL